MLEINTQVVDTTPSFPDLLPEQTRGEDFFLDPLDFSIYAALGSILNEAVADFSYFQGSRFTSLPLSSSPNLGLLEEIELDEEINSLEEEIARIEEHKRILKISSLPGSPLASPPTSSPSYEIKLDFLSASLENLLRSPIEHEITKVEQTIEVTKQMKKSEKNRKRKSPNVLQSKSKKDRFNSVQDCNSTLLPNKKKKVKSRKKPKRVDLAEIFKLEEILKIKNVSQEEDEYVDIL